MTYVKTSQCSSVGIKSWIVILYKRFSNTPDMIHFNKNKDKKVFLTRNLKKKKVFLGAIKSELNLK